MLLIPDPMGRLARRSAVLNHYAKEVQGQPKKVLAVHLIVTPSTCDTSPSTIPRSSCTPPRLDRGLSDPAVLATVPGTHPERERALTDHDYIVPGGGGLGEVINNSFV